VSLDKPAAHVVDVGLDLALGLGAVGFAQPHRKTVVVGASQSLRVEELALESLAASDVSFDDRLGAVVEDLFGHAPEVGEGGPVATPESDQVHRAHHRAEGVS
jgi:hypothetical protein